MSDIAFSLITPLIMGVFIGMYLDKHHAGKIPVWTVTLTILGIITGFWSVYKRSFK